jgi:hypothetical protein
MVIQSNPSIRYLILARVFFFTCSQDLLLTFSFPNALPATPALLSLNWTLV